MHDPLVVVDDNDVITDVSLSGAIRSRHRGESVTVLDTSSSLSVTTESRRRRDDDVSGRREKQKQKSPAAV